MHHKKHSNSRNSHLYVLNSSICQHPDSEDWTIYSSPNLMNYKIMLIKKKYHPTLNPIANQLNKHKKEKFTLQ